MWVSLVLDLLASGWSFADLKANYPSIDDEDICACLAHGAELARHGELELPVGAGA